MVIIIFDFVLTECEDYIIQNISPENLSTILTWSQECSGSRWVYREALQYIQDNFMQVILHYI